MFFQLPTLTFGFLSSKIRNKTCIDAVYVAISLLSLASFLQQNTERRTRKSKVRSDFFHEYLVYTDILITRGIYI